MIVTVVSGEAVCVVWRLFQPGANNVGNLRTSSDGFAGQNGRDAE